MPPIKTKLISDIKISSTNEVIGGAIHVDVRTINPEVWVQINGISATSAFLQFEVPGPRTIAIIASDGKHIERVDRLVSITAPDPKDVVNPLIWSTGDPYRPRTVVFSLGNGADKSFIGAHFLWDFGDGTQSATEDYAIAHDYTGALNRDSTTSLFTVRVEATLSDGRIASARRSIAVLNLYALNKFQHHVLTPLVADQKIQKRTDGYLDFTFTLTNFEDDELVLNGQRRQYLTTKEDDLELPGITTACDILIPSRKSVVVTRSLKAADFTAAGIFGVAFHFAGYCRGQKLAVTASAYFEVRLPFELGGSVSDGKLSRMLFDLASAKLSGDKTISHQDLKVFAQSKAITSRKFGAEQDSSVSDVRQGVVDYLNKPANGGVENLISSPIFVDLSHLEKHGKLDELFKPKYTPVFARLANDFSGPCDPDNMPDDLPEGTVCQFTGEFEWRFVPGRILNAKKGDLVLHPGDSSMIGGLLRQLKSPQHYAHMGIMTKNHVEVRNCTGSESWLEEQREGYKGSNGFKPTALKYGWPGTITQSIDEANFGSDFVAPGTSKAYKLAPLGFTPDAGKGATLAPQVIVKPPPFQETPKVRETLHAIALAATEINGHYRMYCYTRPQMALGSEGIAGADSGWAEGTVALVCSSFVWLAAQRAMVRLETDASLVQDSDLEPGDIMHGAKVGLSTLDGLYHYDAAERQQAAHWLYDTVYFKVLDMETGKALGIPKYLDSPFGVGLDAPDNYANQVCNAFASDWTDLDAADSDEWKNTGDADAVSPQDVTFWDSPGSDNEKSFHSVYGAISETHFLPGTFALSPVYRWNQVATRGLIEGTVVCSSSDVLGTNVSLLGSGKPDVVVSEDGKFTFDKVPSGNFTIQGGRAVGDQWFSAEQIVRVDAGKLSTILLTLNPPPEVNRLVTIKVDMHTHNATGLSAEKADSYENGRLSVSVSPFHSDAGLDFNTPWKPHGHIHFDIHLNPDLSVLISWNAEEVDDEVEGSQSNERTVAKDGWLGWEGLVVANDDPIDSDCTTIGFTVSNLIA